MLGWLIETIGGVYELARLGAITRLRLGGAYWRWRKQTAWGERGGGKWHEVIGYGRWVWRMRRMR